MKTTTFTYQGREITVEYYTEESKMYVEGIEYRGRDITNCIGHEKVLEELAWELYNK